MKAYRFTIPTAAAVFVFAFLAQGSGQLAQGSTIRPASSVKASSSRASVAPVTAPTPPPASLKIPILVYHHIRDTKPYPKSTWSWKMSVSPKKFAEQVQWMTDHNYTAIDLTTYVKIMKGELRGPEKPVVITFDDNQLSQYEIAFPLLKKSGQVGVFYLITNNLKNPQMLDSKRAKEMSDAGMDMESHTLSHVVLTNVNAARLDGELRDSKKLIESITGKPVLHVAYPGTAHNKTVRDHTKAAGYTTGTIMDPRPATPKDDFYKLPRIMMTDDSNLGKVLP